MTFKSDVERGELRPPASTASFLAWRLFARGRATPFDLMSGMMALDPDGSAAAQTAADGLPSRTPIGGFAKSLLDKAVAGTALILALPLMAMVALAVRLSDGGPATYAHPRIGANGRTFRCIKFRTMVINGDEVLERHLRADPEAAREWAETRKLRNDPRVTSIGRFLRRTSLDELPQLINVLRGEMSCVGPRPIVEAELSKYGEGAREYLAARPGITGLWQISGRSNLDYDDRVRLDVLYVRQWSLLLDLVILLRTIPAVLKTGDAV